MTQGRIHAGLVDDRGFTLIELLMVLTIVSLAYLIVVPSSMRSTRSVEVRTTALNLASELRAARAQAIGRGMETAVAVDTQTWRYIVESEGRAVQLPTSLRLTVNFAANLTRDPARSRFVFFSDGSSSGGSISIERDGQTAAVTVDWLTGAVAVEPAR